MLFVKTDRLKQGMRLARPIYNKDGVLLYERNSKLTYQGIQSIRTFGLLGLFILEPAEPVPPMTQEDILFERFQTMTVFAIREELNKIKQDKKKSPKLQSIVNNILQRYGYLNKKINFIQNLRSKEDYIYKHSLNVAILSAMMAHVLNMKREDQINVITAALVHEIGKLSIPNAIAKKDHWTEDELGVIDTYEMAGHELVGNVFPGDPTVKRLCAQMSKALRDARAGNLDNMGKVVLGAKVLMVAETYDTMTAMRLTLPPESEVVAIKHLLGNPEVFEPAIVDALIQSINILIPGVSVELSTREKAIVIRNNEENVLRPMVLGFKDNNIIDLGDRNYKEIEVTDIMKTMDNRYVIDTQTLIENGFPVPVPKEAEMQVGIAQEESANEEATKRKTPEESAKKEAAKGETPEKSAEEEIAKGEALEEPAKEETAQGKALEEVTEEEASKGEALEEAVEKEAVKGEALEEAVEKKASKEEALAESVEEETVKGEH